jgi:hypothetical protein
MPKRRRTRRKSTPGMIVRSAEMLGWALGGIEREIAQTRERLVALTAQAAKLRAQLGARPATAKERLQAAAESLVPKRRRRRMSAAARKRISEMMKKRWAERKKK